MNIYNYEEEVKNDVIKFLTDPLCYIKLPKRRQDVDDAELYNKLVEEQSITGDPNGSYTFDPVQAEQNLAGNWDLLLYALQDFGEMDVNAIEKGAEWCDVTVRQYVLDEILGDVLDEIYKNNYIS